MHNILHKIDLYVPIKLVNSNNVNHVNLLPITWVEHVNKTLNSNSQRNVDTAMKFSLKAISVRLALKHLMTYASQSNAKRLPKMLVQRYSNVNILVWVILRNSNVCLA